MIEIKHRYTGNIIHSGEFLSIKECAEAFVENDHRCIASISAGVE